MRIIFFGTPDFAMPVLESLIKTGYNVSHFKSKPLKDERIFEEFKNLSPDLCVVAAYGKILPSRYLKVPKYGFLNVHPSLLPKYRGPSPIQTAILNGDKETGVSIMVVDEEMDHGPIITKHETQIMNHEYNEALSKRLFTLGAELLIETLPKYINEEIRPEPQGHSQATFTKMFSRDDGRIDWGDSPEKIYNQIRALNPEPGTWTTWNGKIINIKKAELIDPVRSRARTLSASPEDRGAATSNGVDGKLNIQVIQMEGKKEMPFKEFLNGYPDFDISQLK